MVFEFNSLFFVQKAIGEWMVKELNKNKITYSYTFILKVGYTNHLHGF